MKRLILLLLFAVISQVHAAEHFALYQNGTDRNYIKPFCWYAGCAPTASAMVLSYWDNYGEDGSGGSSKYTSWGRLIKYYMDEPAMEEFTDASGVNYKWYYSWSLARPKLIYDLAEHMGTDADEGSTQYVNMSPGINSLISSRGYSQPWSASYIGYSVNGWQWDKLKSEINAGRPVIWSASSPSSGHAICVWGYTDDGMMINYNTWDEMRHDWNYLYYNGGSQEITYSQVNTVNPGAPGDNDSDVELIYPDGGEVLAAGSQVNIQWLQFGGEISKVNIYFSADGGMNWTAAGAGISGSQGANSWSWSVPGAAGTQRGRVRIEGKAGSGGNILGEDGSRENFTVVVHSHTATPTLTSTPSITPTPTITMTHTITPTHSITPTHTVSPTVSPTPGSFEFRLLSVSPSPFRKGTVFNLVTNSDCIALITVYSLSGEAIKEMRHEISYGITPVAWDGRNGAGEKVPGGLYIYRIHAECGGEKKDIYGKTAKIN